MGGAAGAGEAGGGGSWAGGTLAISLPGCSRLSLSGKRPVSDSLSLSFHSGSHAARCHLLGASRHACPLEAVPGGLPSQQHLCQPPVRPACLARGVKL